MKILIENPIIKPISVVASIPSVLVVEMVELKQVVFILIFLFLADFLTGILASYFTWKKTAIVGKWFFGDSQGFSSDKFKKCFVKGCIYAGFPLIVIKFQQVFLIKNMSFSSITPLQFDITTVCVLVFCANELFSIFWENLPKCGLNIPKGIRNLILGVKNITTEVQEETETKTE